MFERRAEERIQHYCPKRKSRAKIALLNGEMLLIIGYI